MKSLKISAGLAEKLAARDGGYYLAKLLRKGNRELARQLNLKKSRKQR